MRWDRPPGLSLCSGEFAWLRNGPGGGVDCEDANAFGEMLDAGDGLFRYDPDAIWRGAARDRSCHGGGARSEGHAGQAGGGRYRIAIRRPAQQPCHRDGAGQLSRRILLGTDSHPAWRGSRGRERALLGEADGGRRRSDGLGGAVAGSRGGIETPHGRRCDGERRRADGRGRTVCDWIGKPRASGPS